MVLNPFQPFYIHVHSPSPVEVVNKGLGVSLCKIRKIIFFLKKVTIGFPMILNLFIPFYIHIYPTKKGL